MRTVWLNLMTLAVVLAACTPDAARQRTYAQPPLETFQETERRLTIDGAEHTALGAEVTETFFEITGGKPMLGRAFLANEFGPKARAVVMLGHTLWETRFGGSPAVIGRDVIIDGGATTIVGVMPLGFAIPAPAEFWVASRRP